MKNLTSEIVFSMFFRSITLSISALFFLVLSSASASSESELVKVVDIKTANFIKVERDGDLATVRLHGISCPKVDENLQKEASRFTREQVKEKLIVVDEMKRLGEKSFSGLVVLSDGRVLNEELITAGMCAWDRKAAPDLDEFGLAENLAKEKGLGIWQRNSADF